MSRAEEIAEMRQRIQALSERLERLAERLADEEGSR